MFEVHVPNPFAASSEIVFPSESAQWLQLRRELQDGSTMRIPESCFHLSRRVQDMGAFRVGPAGSVTVEENLAIERNCVVLLLESPHRFEYDSAGAAIRPLNNPGARKQLQKKLRDLLQQAETLTGQPLGGKQVALVNSIRYQTSLSSLMKPQVRGLQNEVRDELWHALFDGGGANDLRSRIAVYAPSLVLLMPTAGVRKRLSDEFGAQPRNCTWMLVSRHPSGW
jgi:hypothetical protein